MNSRVLPALALLVAVGIFFAYVGPAWSGSIAATKARIAADNQTLEAADQYIRQQNALASARDAIDPANLARLAAFLPDSVDNVGLIVDLNALVARSGLSLANINVTTNAANSANAASANNATALPQQAPQPSQAEMTGSVDLSLSSLGTYAALKTFLAGVERSARLLDVRDMVVKGSDTGVYTYEMKLRLYWLR